MDENVYTAFHAISKTDEFKILGDPEETGFTYMLVSHSRTNSEEGEAVHCISDNFYECFDSLADQSDWFELKLVEVFDDFREYVADRLVKDLSARNFRTYLNTENLEAVLGIQLRRKITKQPTGQDRITILPLQKITDHKHVAGEYYEDGEVPPMLLKQSIQNIEIDNFNSVVFTGKMEVQKNVVVMRDELGSCHVYPVSDFCFRAEPEFREFRNWYYTLVSAEDQQPEIIN